MMSGFEEFVCIVDSGSLTKAADAMALPRPTVSKRLARLEERLGVRLLHRTTRRQTLTREGEVLYAKARHIVAAAREAVTAIERLDNVPRGLLRVQIPPRVPEGVFAGWLTDFLRKYPEVRLDVVGTDEHVDLVAEGFDVALRYGAIEDTTLVSRTLAVNAEFAVASPKYLEQNGTPMRVDDLAHHTCIIGYNGRTAPNPRWPLHGGGWTTVNGTFTTNHPGLCLEAAKRHLGIALVIDQSAAAMLASNELVHVLPDIVGRPDRACLVYPDREYLDPKVRAFVDFIVAQVAKRPAST